MSHKLFNAQMAQYATPTVTGESSVTVVNGVKCYLPELKVDGNTTQEVKNSKNLFNAKDTVFMGQTEFASDITCTKEDDNVFIFTSILSNNPYAHTMQISNFNLKPNTTYTSRVYITLIDNGSSNQRGGESMGASLLLQDNNNYANSVKMYIVDGYSSRDGGKYKVDTVFDGEPHILITTFTTPEDLTPYQYITTRLATNTQVKYENLMIVEGTYTAETFPEYEPYGSYPSPELPSPIINAGDNGVEVEVRGANLLDYKAKTYTQQITEEQIENGIVIKTKSASNNCGIKVFKAIEVEENTTYFLSIECSFLNSLIGKMPNYIFLRVSNNTSIIVTNDKLIYNWPLGTSSEFLTKKTSITIPKGYKYLKVWFYTNVNATDLTTDYQATLKNIMITKENEVPYEPYVEPQIISIPSSVEVDGEVVDLRFAKYDDDNYDSLEIDGVNKKVIYKQRLDEVTIAAEKFTSKYYYANAKSMGISAPEVMPYICTRSNGYCSHADKKYVNDDAYKYRKGGIWIGAVSTYVFWIGIISILGYDADWADKVNPTTDEWDIALAKFQTWLKQHEENGNPFTCIYVIPKTYRKDYDITNTDIGERLLGLVQNNGTSVIEVSNSNNLSQNVQVKYLTHS